MFLIFFQFLQFLKLYTDECGLLMKIFLRANGIIDHKSTAVTCTIIKAMEIFLITLFLILIFYMIYSALVKITRNFRDPSKIQFECPIALESIDICPISKPLYNHKTPPLPDKIEIETESVSSSR